jgi:TonB-linked SusC/RagA family outer membrane protein
VELVPRRAVERPAWRALRHFTPARGGDVVTTMGRDGRRMLCALAVIGGVLALSPPVRAQGTTRRLTGRVIDAEGGAPVYAATVLVNGTTFGTQANDSGAFALRVPAGPITMTVRRLGYTAATVNVTATDDNLVVRLSRDVLHLQEQVVTGVTTTVGTENSANDVAIVNSEELNRVPAPTIENALQGLVPAAIIQQNNGGAPGGGMQIQIRGVTSIFADASPLYVVDGVMVNNETANSGLNTISQSSGGVGPNEQDMSPNRIADINPDDIQSIEVLKGASASAIYGSKASAGVIVITTKKGTAGRPQWNFAQKVGQFAISNTYGLRTFPTLASAQAWANTYGFTQNFIDGVYGGPQNYQAQLFGNGQVSYETDLSVSGTSGSTQYFLSGLLKFDNGSEINTGYNKQTLRTNVTQAILTNLSATLNLNFAHSVTRRALTGNDNIGASPYTVFSYTPQLVSLNHQNADGTWPLNPFGPANPFADAAEMQTPEEVSRAIAGGNIDWTPWQTEHQSLRLTLVGGADYTYQSDKFFAPPDLQVEQVIPSGLPGVSQDNYANTTFLTFSFNLVHHYTGLSWLDATTSVGYIRERRSLDNPTSAGQDLLAGANAPTLGAVQTVVYNAFETKDQSFYAQEQALLLQQRLALTAGVTAEKTTNDGNIDKFYPFPRFSASYRIPQFASWFNELKLRAAYGQSGTQPNYGVKYTPFNTATTGGLAGVYTNLLLGNSAIAPEHEAETELGFDATLFNSRAQFSATVYQKRVNNLLLQANVSPSLGYNEQWFNGGEFTNQGIELQLTATPVQLRNGFTWVSTTSVYRNYSVVNSLPVPSFVLNASGGGNLGTGMIQVGRSVSQLVGANAAGATVQVGDVYPAYVTNFDNEFSFGPLHFGAVVVWSKGGNTGNFSAFQFDVSQGLLADSALSAKRNAENAAGLTAYLSSATFVKIRQLSLSYILPQHWFGWASGRIHSARLSLEGRDLVLWSPYSGLDPEVNFIGNTQVARGQEVTPYPPSRSYFIGLDLGF